jgi:hypothetical protein
VKDLGYKNVLWIDTTIIPLKDLTEVFQKIEDVGYFGYLSSFKVIDYSTDHIFNTFGIDKEMCGNICTIEGGIIGLNLHSINGQNILSEWKKSVINGGFYSARPDQNSFSIITYLLGLKNWDSPATRSHRLEDINDKSIFCVDHTFSEKY